MGDAASRDLLTDLARWPDVVEAAGEQLEPHQVTTYLLELAQAFQTYYNDHQFLVDDAGTRDARLALALAVRQVLANGLDLGGVHAAVKMSVTARRGMSPARRKQGNNGRMPCWGRERDASVWGQGVAGRVDRGG